MFHLSSPSTEFTIYDTVSKTGQKIEREISPLNDTRGQIDPSPFATKFLEQHFFRKSINANHILLKGASLEVNFKIFTQKCYK